MFELDIQKVIQSKKKIVFFQSHSSCTRKTLGDRSVVNAINQSKSKCTKIQYFKLQRQV